VAIIDTSLEPVGFGVDPAPFLAELNREIEWVEAILRQNQAGHVP
jgi:hypothetical protein